MGRVITNARQCLFALMVGSTRNLPRGAPIRRNRFEISLVVLPLYICAGQDFDATMLRRTTFCNLGAFCDSMSPRSLGAQNLPPANGFTPSGVNSGPVVVLILCSSEFQLY